MRCTRAALLLEQRRPRFYQVDDTIRYQMPGVYQGKSHSYDVDLINRKSTYIESIKLVNARIGSEQYTLTPSIWGLVRCRSTFKIVYRCHFIASFHSVVTAFIALYALLSFSTLNFPAATLHGFCFCRPLSDIDIAPASLPILTFSYRFSSLRSYSLNLPCLSLFFGVFSSLGVFTHGFVYP